MPLLLHPIQNTSRHLLLLQQNLRRLFELIIIPPNVHQHVPLHLFDLTRIRLLHAAHLRQVRIKPEVRVRRQQIAQHHVNPFRVRRALDNHLEFVLPRRWSPGRPLLQIFLRPSGAERNHALNRAVGPQELGFVQRYSRGVVHDYPAVLMEVRSGAELAEVHGSSSGGSDGFPEEVVATAVVLRLDAARKSVVAEDVGVETGLVDDRWDCAELWKMAAYKGQVIRQEDRGFLKRSFHEAAHSCIGRIVKHEDTAYQSEEISSSRC